MIVAASLPCVLVVAALARAALRAQDAGWNAVVAKARGQTVNCNAWAGDEKTNAFIAWVGDEVERRYGVKVKHVKLKDTAEAVHARRRREGGRPRHRRQRRPDLDQRPQLPRAEGAAAAVRPVRDAAAELALRRHR